MKATSARHRHVNPLDSVTLLLNAGNLTGALAEINEWLLSSPSDENRLLSVAERLLEHCHYAQAADYLLKAKKINPASVVINHQLGNVYYHLRELDNAMACYLAALDADNRHPESNHNLGVVFRDQGKLQNAIVCFSAAIELNPHYVQAYHNLYAALNETKQIDSILHYAKKALNYLADDYLSYWHLGNCYVKKQQVNKAIEYYQKAIQVNSDFIDAYSNLAIVLENKGEYVSAINYCQKALEKSPDHLICLMTIAACFNQLEDTTSTMHYYRRALSIDENNIVANYNYASQLHRCGEFKQAEWHYKKVFALDSRIVEALDHLSKLLPPAEFEAQYKQQIFTMLDNNALSEKKQSSLFFALASCADKLGNYDEALCYIRQANQLERTLIKEKARFDVGFMQKMIDDFPLEFQLSEKIEQPLFHIPVFIVGMPRSGTTLTEQILVTSDEVASCGELTLLQQFILVAEEETGIRYPECLKALTMQTFQEFRNLYLKSQAEKYPQAKMIIDKQPLNFMSLGLIRLIFPEAKIISCVREEKDTCLSCYFQNFTLGNVFSFDWEETLAFYSQYRKLMTYWKKRQFIEIFEIKYENLVNDFEATTQALFSWMSLEWHPDCQYFYNNKNDVKTASKWQVRQALYKNSIGRWKNYPDLFVAP
ncbi:MAG TPA: sulfotransferase family protein [Gammaproteobacteria bacterium]|nr:sulfotransferase family protein [Gammaproteobacteria bacterium]